MDRILCPLLPKEGLGAVSVLSIKLGDVNFEGVFFFGGGAADKAAGNEDGGVGDLAEIDGFSVQQDLLNAALAVVGFGGVLVDDFEAASGERGLHLNLAPG